MRIFSRVAGYIFHFSARRRYRHTERVISALPVEVLKDIGWPGTARGVESDR